MSLIDLYIRDKDSGKIHKIGENQHDMLTIVNGTLIYQHLQNGDGCTLGMNVGGYEFVDNADDYGYNCDPREES